MTKLSCEIPTLSVTSILSSHVELSYLFIISCQVRVLTSLNLAVPIQIVRKIFVPQISKEI